MTPKKYTTPLIAALCGLLTVGAVHAKTLLVDFGDSANPTNITGWNNASTSTTSLNLVDDTGASSGCAMTVTSPFNTYGANTNGPTDSSGYLLGFPNSATRDSLYANVASFGGHANLTPILTFSGLDPRSIYTFTLLAARMNVGDIRSGTYEAVGMNIVSGDLDAANNQTNLLTLPGVRPDGSGVITLRISPAPDNNNAYQFFYLNALRIESSDAVFHWGVTGHPNKTTVISSAYDPVVPYSGSSSTSPVGQVDLLEELGCDYYRIGTDEATLDEFLSITTPKNISLLAVLATDDKIFGTTRTLSDIYNGCKAKAQAFATKYQGQIKYVELANELDYNCLISGAYSGTSPTDYDDTKYACAMNALKGLSDGIAAGDPSMKRIINTVGWYHYGYLDRLITDGVAFDVIGWHWYSEMGSMSRVMQKLSSYGKPIWVTEVDRRGGSYQADQLFSDNFSADTVGVAPSAWTASGNWLVNNSYSGQKLVVEQDAHGTPGGRSLSRTFTSNIQGNWELSFDYDWKYGGTPSYGSTNLRIDCDVTDGSGNGYRLRTYQGNGGNTANNNAILLIYRLTGGAPTLLAQGPGYNDGGFATRSLGAAVLKHLCFRRDRTNNQLTVQYNDPNETDATKQWKVSATANDSTYDDSTYDDFTQVTINVGGFDATEQPMVDNLSFTHAYVDEDAQARTLAQMLEEIHGFPQIQALFVYELLNEPNLGTFNPEAYYGLCSLTKDEQGNRIFEHRKPAFYAFADAIAAHGFIQPAVADGQVIDDAYDYPAMKYAPTTDVWTSQSSLPDYYYEGYRDDGGVNTSSANYVRFYAYIPTSGNYEVSIRQPADSGNASSVPVSIHHAGTVASATVDQRTGGDWQVIGTYYFNAWQPGYQYGGTGWENATDAAYLQVGNTGTYGHVLIDAVRFRPTP